MKLPILLFSAAILSLLVVPFTIERVASYDLAKNGLASSVVKNYLNFHTDTTTVSQQEVTEFRSVNFFNKIIVGGGIQLINDVALGDKIKLIGPPEALELIRTFTNESTFYLNFSKPILLDKPVQVHLNLAAHHVGSLNIQLGKQTAGFSFQSLVTKKPITGRFVTVGGSTPTTSPVQVDVENLAWYADGAAKENQQEPVKLKGKVNKFETRASSLNSINLQELEAEKSALSGNIPSGNTYRVSGKKVSFFYYNQDGELNEQLLNVVPDTLIVSSSAQVEAKLTIDGAVNVLDGLVHVIRE